MRIATLSLMAALGASFALASACGTTDEQPAPGPSDASVPDSGPDDTPDAAPLPPLETQAPAVVAVASRKDATSSMVVFDPLRGGVWTANGDSGSISYVDVDGQKVGREVAIGKDIRSVALSPDGVWVAAVDRDGQSVTLVEAETGKVRRTLAVGTHPRAALWDAADPRWLYVVVEDSDAVVVIDRVAGAIARTIAVGHLPSGVAVSRQRRELYVTHRVDGKVSVFPLDAIAGDPPPVAPDPDSGIAPPLPPPPATGVDVPLALEDGDGTATTPHGTPFAFESLAWAADGNVAWLPHQLLANTHPFQFQSTVFPAVSVVDLGARAEVATDPADPLGYIAGRKNLFAAINIIDEQGNTTILSQPCAAAMHPNGAVAYVLACASEDLLTFDIEQGIAVDILRNLPGDHPVGLTLDDTGQRAFIVSDQSHSLATVDLASGSLVGHAKLVGGALPLAAKDPVDPDLRAGLTLFYRSTSSKGALATSGNNWMACASCHLDGFVSTNAFFFDALKADDPTKDARIGHTGLKDFFSRTPPTNAADQPAFDPHDILVALTEQGGLAPDRTGAHRDGAVDPSAPTADATTMARQIAKVVSRDLPLGPTWLLPGADKQNVDYDGKWCGECHAKEYAAWQKSAHAHAEMDPMLHFCAGVEVANNGTQYPRLCAGCHAPTSAQVGDTSLTTGRGVTCLGCHGTERLIRAGGNGDTEVKAYDWSKNHADRAKAALVRLRDPLFCSSCHQQFTPGTGTIDIGTYSEWHVSSYAGPDGVTPTDTQTKCVDCHAPKTDGVADHRMAGGNVYYAQEIANDPEMIAAEKALLQKAMALTARREGGAVIVTVANVGAGHAFPTGVTDIREPWVELQAVDASGVAVARYGGPAADGTIPSTAARFGMDIAKADGTVLLQHELSASTRVTFSRFVPAGGQVEVFLTAPASLPTGAVRLDAVLLYRNIRTPYYRLAVNNPTALPPEAEVARAAVP